MVTITAHLMFNALIYFLIGILVIASLLLVLIVLMQRPKNEGLGASFGGGMTQDLFGAQTTSVLQKFTVYLGGAFFAISLLLTILYSKSSNSESGALKLLEAAAANQPVIPAAPPAPATTPVDSAASAQSTGGTVPLETSTVPVESAVPTESSAPAIPDASPLAEPTATPQ